METGLPWARHSEGKLDICGLHSVPSTLVLFQERASYSVDVTQLDSCGLKAQ